MLFPTVEFAIFFGLVFALSWACAGWPLVRKSVLVVASFIFYGWWDYRFAFLLFNCTMANYIFGLILDRYDHDKQRRLIATIAVIFNLGILAYFKYTGFFLSSLNDLLNTLGLDQAVKVAEVILPVGVSFYTFQGISYVVDIYQRRMQAVESPLDMLLFKSFFPQLVAGPIVRASDFLPQLSKTPSQLRATRALLLIAFGLLKKVVLANYLATDLVNPVFSSPKTHSTIDLILAAYGYAVQIYCDFSAYTDMAIGVALLFGYEFPTNFNQPYRAASLQDFWRRWHMSLSAFLKDYLYIPLGGSRGSSSKTYRNLMLTMILGGLWHGAAWTFVIWGTLHGAGLCVERALQHSKASTRQTRQTVWFKPFQIVFTFHYVCLAWIFFNAESLSSALSYLRSLGNTEIQAKYLTPFSVFLIGCGLMTQFVKSDLLDKIEARAMQIPLPLQATAMAFVVVVVTALSPGSLAPFIYFRF
jgi:D-alanyl-lipoteichoic acid acyltransferase DltB (MBOAT superfamily)